MKIKKIMTGIIATLLSITTLFSGSIVYAENLRSLLFQHLGNYDEVTQCDLYKKELPREITETFLDEQKEEFIRLGISSSGRSFFKISEYKLLDPFIPPISDSVDPLVLGIYLYVINHFFESYPNIKESLFQILRGFDKCYHSSLMRATMGSFNIGVGCSPVDDKNVEQVRIVSSGKVIDKITRNMYADILGLHLNLRAYSYPIPGEKRRSKSVNTILEEYLYRKRSEADPDTPYYMSKPTCPFNIIAEPAIRAMGKICLQIAFFHYAAANGGFNSDSKEQIKKVKQDFRKLVASYFGHASISDKEIVGYFCCMYQMHDTDDPIIQGRGQSMVRLLDYLNKVHGDCPYSTLKDSIVFW